MAFGKFSVTQQTLDMRLKEAAEGVFEPRLRELGLAVDQIEAQDLDQLQDSLERINDALKMPQSFGEVTVNISSSAGVVIARSTADGSLTLGILPLLLERKRLILSRIRGLGGRDAEQALERLASAGNGGGDTAAAGSRRA